MSLSNVNSIAASVASAVNSLQNYDGSPDSAAEVGTAAGQLIGVLFTFAGNSEDIFKSASFRGAEKLFLGIGVGSLAKFGVVQAGLSASALINAETPEQTISASLGLAAGVTSSLAALAIGFPPAAIALGTLSVALSAAQIAFDNRESIAEALDAVVVAWNDVMEYLSDSFIEAMNAVDEITTEMLDEAINAVEFTEQKFEDAQKLISDLLFEFDPLNIVPPSIQTPTPDPISPLVLDLDGDGVETVGLDSNIHFDHNGDGFKETTGWAGADDGLLVLDRNGDGQINDGSELFGNNTQLANGQAASNGFEALAELDSNSDGVINAQDAQFADLKVFRDANQNGVTDEGELIAMNDAGVQSINVGYTESTAIDEFGNSLRQEGSYTTTDGQQRDVVDVWFNADATRTTTDELGVTESIAALPDALGFGTTYSLHQAMARDTSGELQALVSQFVSVGTRQERLDLLDQIIFKWTGQEGNYQPHHQAEIDSRKIGAIESFYGFKLPLPQGSGVQYTAEYERIYSNWSDKVFYQLAAGSYLAPFFAQVQWTLNQQTNTYEGDFSQTIDELTFFSTLIPEKAQDILQDFAQAVHGVNVYSDVNLTNLQNQINEFLSTADLSSYSEGAIAMVKAFGAGTGLGDDLIEGGGGDDVLYGFAGNDTLIGNGGNDLLAGGSGNDLLQGNGGGSAVYQFGVGDGQDRVINLADPGNEDTIHMVGGLVASDITVTRQGDDLLVAINNTEDRIRVVGHFANEQLSSSYVDAIVFDDGSRIETGPDYFASIEVVAAPVNTFYGSAQADLISGDSGNNTIYGGDGGDSLSGNGGDDVIHGEQDDDTLNGGAGNDQLFGGYGNDQITGGQGDDILDGGQGNDTFFFNLGDGLDVIDNFFNSVDQDTLVLGAGILSQNLTVLRDGIDLIIAPNPGVDEVRVRDFFNSQAQSFAFVQFSDPASAQAVWNVQDLEAVAQSGTQLDDQIYGDADDNTINAQAGNDEVFGAAGNDTLNGGNGDDLLYGQQGDDSLFGGQGTDTLYGGLGNDVLHGGAGVDYLSGEQGADTYLFNTGDGQAYIYDGKSLDANGQRHINRLVFGAGIVASDVLVQRANSSSDLVLTIQSTGDAVYLNAFFDHSDNQIEQVEFQDGTVWTPAQLQGLANGGTNGDDSLIGTAFDDVIYGMGGNDYLEGGAGNDLLDGGAGGDYMDGGTGNDQLIGGAGDDYMSGGDGDDVLSAGPGLNDFVEGNSGSDTYQFNLGDGALQIQDDFSTDSNGQRHMDRLLFGAGISASDVRASQLFGDLVLTVQSTGETVQIYSFFYGNEYELEQVQFEDGTTWTSQDLKDLINQGLATNGDDILYGDANNNDISGLAGNDTLYGRAGADKLYGNAGNDRLYGQNGDDLLNGGSGDDYLNGGNGNDRLLGGAGKDRLIGGAGNDILNGGGGNDILRGNVGNDIYVFNKASGRDVIINSDNQTSSFDRARFNNVSYQDLWFSRTNQDLRITVAGTNTQVRVKDWYVGHANQLDLIQAGSAKLRFAQIDTLVNAMAAYDVPLGSGNVIPSDVQDELKATLAEAWQNVA